MATCKQLSAALKASPGHSSLSKASRPYFRNEENHPGLSCSGAEKPSHLGLAASAAGPSSAAEKPIGLNKSVFALAPCSRSAAAPAFESPKWLSL